MDSPDEAPPELEIDEAAAETRSASRTANNKSAPHDWRYKMNDFADAETIREEKKIREVIGKHNLPASIRTFELEFGTDSTGDPAVTIWFIVDDDANPTKQVLDQTTRFVRDAENELMRLKLHHWPFIRFSPASEARLYFGESNVASKGPA